MNLAALLIFALNPPPASLSQHVTRAYLVGEWEVEGSNTCGTGEAAMLFLANGTVSVIEEVWTYSIPFEGIVEFRRGRQSYRHMVSVIDENRFRDQLLGSIESVVMARCR